jgi:hypothetical protein
MSRAASAMRCQRITVWRLISTLTSRRGRRGSPVLSRSAAGRTGALTGKPMHRVDAWCLVQRRAADLGARVRIGCHTFRATGITAYLEADLIERDLVAGAIIELCGARAFVRRHRLRVFQCADALRRMPGASRIDAHRKARCTRFYIRLPKYERINSTENAPNTPNTLPAITNSASRTSVFSVSLQITIACIGTSRLGTILDALWSTSVSPRA